MSTTELSDAEVHEVVMKRFETMTREEWQARLDEAKAAFDRQEAMEQAYAGSGSRAKPKSTSKSPLKTVETVSG